MTVIAIASMGCVATSPDQTGQQSNRSFNRTGSRMNLTGEQLARMQQASVDACAGKGTGDSCTVSFGNFTGRTSSQNGSYNGTQPSGTCQAANGTLSCKMQRPTGVGR